MPIFNSLNRCNSCGCHVSEPHSPQCPTQCVSLMYQRAQASRRGGGECCEWQLCTSAAQVWRVGSGASRTLEAFGYCAEHAPIVAQALVTYGREVAWCGCSNCLNGLNQPAPVVCVGEVRATYPSAGEDECCGCGERNARMVWITRDDSPNMAWHYDAACARELLAEQRLGYFHGLSVCPCAQCSPAMPARAAAQAAAQPAAAVFAPRVERVKGRGLVGVAVYL